MRTAAATRRAILGIAAILLPAMSPAAKGAIIFDGTLGPRSALAGPSFAITAELGRQTGANLFHSFSQFNLASGESATFSGPASVANIVGRVTGGSASQIDGLLRSTITGANLYLINPKGIAFGPNASLDVSGSFHASSADYLKFADGARFDASNPQTSTFTSASPATFGFLGPNPSAITVNGATLSVPAGRTLSLVGGDIQLNNATVLAPSGRANVASVTSAGEITFDALGIAAQSVSKFGTVTLSNSSIETDSTGGNAAGAIHIRGGRFVLKNSSLRSVNAESGTGGPIQAILAEEIVIDGQGASIHTRTEGDGGAGPIRLEAPVIALDNGGNINSAAFTKGAGGAISLAASTLSLNNGANIETVTTGSGSGGAITIAVNERIAVSGKDSRISSVTALGSGGNAGPINIKAPIIAVSDGAGIKTATSGSGAGGAITITAGERITLSAARSQISSSAKSDSSGNAGAISIKAPSIAISDGAGIASDTGGAGNGGTVSIDTGDLQLTRDGSVSAITEGAGHGGSIDISARAISISGGKAYPAGEPDKAIPELTYFGFYSGLYATSQSGATGKAGQVRINTDTLQISDGGLISGVTLGKGDAGSFDIQAGSVTLDGGGLIHTSTSGTGAAGSIAINATESLRASGRLDEAKYSGFAPRGSQSSGVTSKATVDLNPTAPVLGNAGSIAVTAPFVSLADGAEVSTSSAKNARGGTIAITGANIEIVRVASVSSESRGTGNAGSIAIRSTNALRILEGGSVTTEATSADGGDIDIRAATLVHLGDSRITTSVGTGSGNGGNIFIDPEFVVLNGGRIIANAFGGNGGNIRIAAQNYLASPDSVVEASSQLGIAGTIQITSPNSDVGAGLAVLPANFFDAANMLRASCAPRGTGSASSLVAIGRGGLPISADGYLPMFMDLGARSPSAAALPQPIRTSADAGRVLNTLGSLHTILPRQAQLPCGS